MRPSAPAWLALIAALALLWVLVAGQVWAQDPVEGWNPAWPIEGNTNVTIYTNWLAKDLWRAADERLRALGPATQASNDQWGFNYIYASTCQVGSTASVQSVTWTNHGTAIVTAVTSWWPQYEVITLTNVFDPVVVGSATCTPRLGAEFLEALDTAILTALGGYVIEYYDDISVPRRFNDWFALDDAGTHPAMFPLASKVDVADKYGRAVGQHYAQAFGQTTNAYGQATNGVGCFVKRYARPMFLPLAEWTCGTNNDWTERTFWRGTYLASAWGGAASVGYQYGPDASMRLESRLVGNVGTPRWRWYAGKTNSVFGSLTVEFGDLAAVTVYDQTNALHDLDTYYDTSYTETVSGTNQSAAQAFVHWWSAPTVSGSGKAGDRLVLVWQEPQFTTWEDGAAWDAELFAEALDARWKFLDLMRCTVATNWTWVDGECVTNSTTITNVDENHYQTNITPDVWTNVYPPEDVISWWVPTGATPYVEGFTVNALDYYLPPAASTSSVGDGVAPSGTVALNPDLYFFEGIAYIMTDPEGVANDPDVIQDFLINQVSNSVFSTTLFPGPWDYAQQDLWSKLAIEMAATSAIVEARGIWTGRQHRVHYYTRNDGTLSYNPTPPITTVTTTRHRLEVGAWNYDPTTQSTRVSASQDAPGDTWYISGPTNTEDTGFYFEPYNTNTMVKIRREVSADQIDQRDYLLRNTVEGGPHLIEWNFWK